MGFTTDIKVTITQHGRIVASARLIPVNYKAVLVEDVFVEPEYRHHGIGKELMRKVEDKARESGFKYIKLFSQKPAGQALYSSLGYVEGKAYFKDLGG